MTLRPGSGPVLFVVTALVATSLLVPPQLGPGWADPPRSADATVLGGGPSSASWPTYLHDAARTGTASVDRDALGMTNDTDLGPVKAPTLHLLWNRSTGGPIAAQPIVAGGTVYVGSYDGNFYALNELTGAKKWVTSLGTVLQPNCSSVPRGITSSATISGGVVYVGGGSPYWYALNASNGKVLWKIFTGSSASYYNWGSPLLVGHYAYIGLSSACDLPLIPAQLWMVNLTNHSIAHAFDVVKHPGVGGSIWSSPTFDASTHTVFITTGNGQTPKQPYVEAIVALNSTDLALRGAWRVPPSATGPDSDFGTTPTLLDTVGGRLLVEAANKNGLAYAWNRTNVSAGPLWTDRLAIGGQCPECGQGSVSSGAYNGTTLFLAGGKTTIGSTSFAGAVRAVNPATGAFLWQFGAKGFVLPAMTYGDGLLVAGAGSDLDVLDASNGSLLFQLNTGHLIYGPASIVGNCVFASSTGGQVFALVPKGMSCADTDSVVLPRGGLSDAPPGALRSGVSVPTAAPMAIPAARTGAVATAVRRARG